MLTIWKYEIHDPDGTQFDIPQGAIPRACELRPEGPCIWLQLDPERQTYPRRFRVFATGEPIPHEALTYCGTFFDGPQVWHVYEVPAVSS